MYGELGWLVYNHEVFIFEEDGVAYGQVCVIGQVLPRVIWCPLVKGRKAQDVFQFQSGIGLYSFFVYPYLTVADYAVQMALGNVASA